MNSDSGTHAWRSMAAWGNLAMLLLLGVIVAALASLQRDAWWQAMPRSDRWWGAGAAVLAYFLFCAAITWRSRSRTLHDEPGAASTRSIVLVAYASQTGFAQQLAERTADNLRNSGLAVKLRAIEQVDAALLAQADRALFVASTTGEGDPPDPALAFVRGAMMQPLALGHLQYAVLALGDREYAHFCGFGHQLDNWLRRHGAQPLFDMVEVDNADESALRHWQHHIGQISGVTDQPDWTTPRYESWRLQERTVLNPGSVGEKVFHLAIAVPTGTSPQWVAGDIAEIGPRQSPQSVQALLDATGLAYATSVDLNGQYEPLGDVLARSHLPFHDHASGLNAQALADTLEPLPHREYSIASLPIDGTLQLVVRRMQRPDGSPGLGSGWLCDHAKSGDGIALRLRSNPNFHAPAPVRPMILIGNGTGIAGLRAHLKARIAVGARRNWLLFGERNAERDFFFGSDVLDWQARGFIERLDLAFSRDQERRLYVQHTLQQAAGTLREWIAEGAAIYVCGSLSGMAPAVDAVLRDVLGHAAVEDLLASGRYRRDVY